MAQSTCNIYLQPAGRKITAEANDGLLETLIANNILLRSDCGGKGVCGKCQVEVLHESGDLTETEACTLRVTGDMTLRIPETSLLSSNIISKPPAALPASFTSQGKKSAVAELGVAVDLGTTTIALYLCDIGSRKVLYSLAVKNPQALHGDDVMSRIGWIGQDATRLARLQQLVVHAIEWGIRELVGHFSADHESLRRMVVVGNPTMIHILLGVDPFPIGFSPYQPVFAEARRTTASRVGFTFPKATVHTLEQISGFLGGDILAATLASTLENEPEGTLLIDLGTNGELVLKAKDTFFATSCATGPVFEGAALSCGLKAIPGAIDRVIGNGPDTTPDYRIIQKSRGEKRSPSGICGSGVISAIASMLRTEVINKSGLLKIPTDSLTQISSTGKKEYVIVPGKNSATGKNISISQKDIRAVQLGKSALITGIEYLLRAAGLKVPEKILIAGAFGSNLDRSDLLTLGMIPFLHPSRIEMTGNSAGAGAIMLLCDETYFAQIENLVKKISVIELATNIDFQQTFVERLSFPDLDCLHTLFR
jgi:uncharacterized 2Fe-2S/4Fe-4S cluster protein (DUF4445 family)